MRCILNRLNVQKQVNEIKQRIEQALAEPEKVGLYQGYTDDKHTLAIEISKLRRYGVEVRLLSNFVGNNGEVYLEVAAEVLRQIELWEHPIREWIKANSVALLALLSSIASVVVAIVALTK